MYYYVLICKLSVMDATEENNAVSRNICPGKWGNILCHVFVMVLMQFRV
jgi:hypothetical protein